MLIRPFARAYTSPDTNTLSTPAPNTLTNIKRVVVDEGAAGQASASVMTAQCPTTATGRHVLVVRAGTKPLRLHTISVHAASSAQGGRQVDTESTGNIPAVAPMVRLAASTRGYFTSASQRSERIRYVKPGETGNVKQCGFYFCFGRAEEEEEGRGGGTGVTGYSGECLASHTRVPRGVRAAKRTGSGWPPLNPI